MQDRCQFLHQFMFQAYLYHRPRIFNFHNKNRTIRTGVWLNFFPEPNMSWENSSVTQTTPEPTLLSWGGWPREKISSHPWPPCQTRSYRAYEATQTPLFSKPFDVSLWYSGVPRSPNLLKISSDIESNFRNGFFRHIAHRFESWINCLWPLLAKLHKNAFDAVARSSNAWWLPTELTGGGILCSGAWKRGQGSHAAVVSLWKFRNSWKVCW